jgi:hypothetical protein
MQSMPAAFRYVLLRRVAVGIQRQWRIGATFAIALIVVTFGAVGSASATASSTGPVAREAVSSQLSVPARDLPPASSATTESRLRSQPATGLPLTTSFMAALTDTIAASSQTNASLTPAADLSFDGTQNPFACGGCTPPDTTGDVGPNRFVQVVNATKVAVYDKSGSLQAPPFDLGDLWGTGACSENAGDPQVNYDGLADRWVLAQFADPRELCFAVSETPDPLGAYHLYQFEVPTFPDYFKIGVWRNGYYVSANEEDGYSAYAFDRPKMLAGNPSASFVRFGGETNFLMPADVDGKNAGAAGGGLFYTFKDSDFHGGGPDRIELFQLDPDFTVPANSTFTVIKTFDVAPFTYTVCGFFNFNCIPQKDSTRTVDAVSEWPMQRFAYRKIGPRQELVGNFTVGGGSAVPGAAIRWFELRRGGGSWTLQQEGTLDPGDGLNRFMGSISIDQDGNIALGYSASSSAAYPSIRYSTRTPSDPPGTMGPEQILQAGGGSQTGSNRWGDYSAMSADPSVGCRFWYTNEYYATNSARSWKTRIGAFTMPGCSS